MLPRRSTRKVPKANVPPKKPSVRAKTSGRALRSPDTPKLKHMTQTKLKLVPVILLPLPRRATSVQPSTTVTVSNDADKSQDSKVNTKSTVVNDNMQVVTPTRSLVINDQALESQSDDNDIQPLVVSGIKRKIRLQVLSDESEEEVYQFTPSKRQNLSNMLAETSPNITASRVKRPDGDKYLSYSNNNNEYKQQDHINKFKNQQKREIVKVDDNSTECDDTDGEKFDVEAQNIIGDKAGGRTRRNQRNMFKEKLQKLVKAKTQGKSRSLESDKETDDDDDETSSSDGSSSIEQFVIQDPDGVDTPTAVTSVLPPEFRMSRYSSYIQKLIEYYVILALNPTFIKELSKVENEEYMWAMNRFKSDLGQRLQNLQSTAWTRLFRHDLETYPTYKSHFLPDNIDFCDVCARPDRHSTFSIIFLGAPYDKETLKILPKDEYGNATSSESEGDELIATDHNSYLYRLQQGGKEGKKPHTYVAGRHCKLRSQSYHRVYHYPYALFRRVVNQLVSRGIDKSLVAWALTTEKEKEEKEPSTSKTERIMAELIADGKFIEQEAKGLVYLLEQADDILVNRIKSVTLE